MRFRLGIYEAGLDGIFHCDIVMVGFEELNLQCMRILKTVPVSVFCWNSSYFLLRSEVAIFS